MTQSPKRFLQIVLNNFTNDSRILKQSSSLNDDSNWNVTVFALQDRGQSLQEFVSFGEVKRFALITRSLPKIKILQLIKYVECWLRMLHMALRVKPDCVQANDLNTLPIGLSIANTLNIPLIYDAHELETEVNGLTKGSFQQLLMVWLEKVLIKKANAVITVSNSIADWYRDKYEIKTPEIVLNIPLPLSDISSPIKLKRKMDIAETSLLFLYLGNVVAGRGIHRLLEAFSQANMDKHILFIGSGDLTTLIQEYSSRHSNIHYIPAVSSDQVVQYAVGADVGLCLLENVSLSDYYSLPNKMFEYILAGLPVCTNHFPEQKAFVESHDCGWVIDDSISNTVKFVNEISVKDVIAKRENVLHIQKDISWKNEAVKYLTTVNSALLDHTKRT